MANISFKRGSNLNNLAITDGQFIVNTAERSIYVDVGTERLRIGDFVSVANTEALPTAGANETALYYVEDINCLAKWNGTGWTQINRDSGAVNFTVTGDGNAITDVTYDAKTRTLTLTKGVTFTTPAVVDGKISDKVGELKIGETTYDTVKAYVDKKTSGIATDASLSALTDRVTAAESDIDALQTATAEGGAVSNAIADAKKAGTDAKAAADAAKGAADAAQKSANDAQADVDALEGKVGTVAEGKTVTGLISEAKTAADAAQADVDALETKVGTVPADKNVVGMIGDVETAYKDADTALAASIKAISDDYLTSDDKTELQGNINKKVDQTTYDSKVAELVSADTTLQGNIDAEKTARENADKAQVTRIANLESQITGLSGAMHFEGVKAELPTDVSGYESGDVIIVGEKEYVFNGTKFVEFGDVSAEGERIAALETTVGDATSGLVKSVADNATAIATEKSRAEVAEKTNADAISALETSVSGTYETKVDATSKLTEAKNYADGLNTAMDARVDALEAIDHSAYALKTDVASSQSAQDTKINANTSAIGTLNGADTVEGSVAKKIKDAIAAENLSQYATDTELSALDARVVVVEGKAHTHDNKAELDKIATGDKAKWDAVVEDHLVAADKTALENAIATKANSADVYTKTEVDAKLTDALSWGEF